MAARQNITVAIDGALRKRARAIAGARVVNPLRQFSGGPYSKPLPQAGVGSRNQSFAGAVFVADDFFAAALFLAAAFFFGAAFFTGASAEAPAFFAAAALAGAAFRPHRPLRSGAAAMIAWHSSSVSDFGSRSFGILPFFLPSVM